MKLIIVESPTKAKTIKKFLGKEYKTISSYGHVRDLPKSKIGVDIGNDFEPEYVAVSKASKNIEQIRKLVKKSDMTLLATDPDREGEAISWHLIEMLKLPKEKYGRIVFHEITEGAIKESLSHPKEIDMNLVNAQQARRILDRIVGYKLSPFLWKKVARGLSAGRVQSVALRFVTDREKEINAFQKDEYWNIYAEMRSKTADFPASLIKIGEEKIDKLFIKDKKQAESLVLILKKQNFSVSEIKRKEVKKSPLPPFITSTLQQEANKKLRFSSKLTMRIAQQLYEKGLTTYHRTDSYNLSGYSVTLAKEFIIANYGENYWKGVVYKKKSKGAQEAHEAIRPSYPEQSPERLNTELDKRQLALYDLIWRRFIASLMSPAIMDQISIDIETKPESFTLRSSGQTMRFDGFLKVYPIKLEEKILPNLKEGEALELIKLIPNQHFTQPPARYNEATLIKVLEQKGIGRPSTYAPTLSIIQERNYVKKNEEKRFVPTDIGMIVSDLLVNHFSDIVNAEFTAQIEEKLDKIAEGKAEWRTILKSFYTPFAKLLKEKEIEINKKDITEKEIDEICEKCKSKMVLKVGRFGSFLACSNYPECKNTKSPKEEESEEPCEKCGSKMVKKRSRFGSFWGCSNYPECKGIRKDEEKIGIKCPECGEGDVIKKKSKRGRFFYGCSRYPECEFLSNKKPG